MISIIVPVYNSEKHLARCIESVISQKEKDWELILVDDGSNDNSPNLCDYYGRDNKKIHVYHSSNKGVSSARNKGIELAKGEWITFLDSDDWLASDHLQCFAQQLEKEVDLCINSFIVELKYGSRSHHYPDILTESNEESIYAFYTKLLQHSQFLWNKIFKKEIIDSNNIHFDTNVSLGEDNIFILEYMNYVERLSSSSKCTYHYDQMDENPLSLGRRKRSTSELLYQIQKNCDAILELYNKYKMTILHEHASNYYYTRIFQRIIVQTARQNSLLVCFIPNLIENIKLYPILESSKVKDKTIKQFWANISSDKKVLATIILNYYILKIWLTSKIINCVVAVKRAFRNVQNNV